METFPDDDRYNPETYQTALANLSPGSAVIIVTPDDTHAELAEAAIRRGMHLLVVKPLVKTLAEHHKLHTLAQQQGVLLASEMHKRFDPVYADARDQARDMGDFSYCYSYMSQPLTQLDTFREWAGKASDVSYYLNSHHIDWLVWTLMGTARPEMVSATSATGTASAYLGRPAEDTITISVQWRNLISGHRGTSVHTASWIAPKTDAHSQQHFFYMGQQGQIQVDQARRGYSIATAASGYTSMNPLFMKYLPTDGRFSGQNAYGYRSIECFLDAAAHPEQAKKNALALAADTLQCTAILEAGRLSLDSEVPVKIKYDQTATCVPIGIH